VFKIAAYGIKIKFKYCSVHVHCTNYLIQVRLVLIYIL